ncbi:MAG: HSP90 family protein [Trueperaceae bacterium]
MDHRFQVDLRGIIEILSEHLYSGPQVFLRELLQNAVDAITAREKFDKGFQPTVTLELSNEGGTPVLVFKDNGVGLLEEEVHQFLATIGKSSKRATKGAATDFIGQFGIGLLSCFVVSDDIVLLSRSAKGEGVVEFRGSPEGSYSVRTVSENMDIGSKVTLRAKRGMEHFFKVEEVLRLAQHYGGLLPYPIYLLTDGGEKHVNAGGAIWRRSYETAEKRQAALLEFGTDVLGREPFDIIDIQTTSGKLDGVALVLPWTPSVATKSKHVVYLKNMLLADDAEGVVPEWAFFVKLVVNANALKPTASREGFAEDAALEGAREEVGEQLQEYLSNLAEQQPAKFRALLRLHDLTLKALALENEELFALFAPRLEFETSSGTMTLGEYLKNLPPQHSGAIYYAANIEQFRQMSRVAGAQGFNIINGGYVYAAELLERYAIHNPHITASRVEADFFANRFEELSIGERNSSFEFLHSVTEILQRMGCGVELLHFKPKELPTLFVTSSQQRYLRSIENAQEVASDLFGDVLESLKPVPTLPNTARPNTASSMVGHLYLNMSNALIRRLATLSDSAKVRSVIEVLYVQALLLGHHPLSQRELSALTEGLSSLIEFGLANEGVGRVAN